MVVSTSSPPMHETVAGPETATTKKRRKFSCKMLTAGILRVSAPKGFVQKQEDPAASTVRALDAEGDSDNGCPSTAGLEL